MDKRYVFQLNAISRHYYNVSRTECMLYIVNVAFNNFKSYHDGVRLRQGAQCSLL